VNAVLQVEFSPSLLSEREAILKRHGYPVVSVLGSSNAQSLDVFTLRIGVVVMDMVLPGRSARI